MPGSHKWTSEEIQAAAIAFREEVRKICDEEGLTVREIIRELYDQVHAKQTKASYGKGTWSYSAPLVDNMARIKAIDIALRLIDAYPTEKIDSTHHLDQNLVDQVIQARINARKNGQSS